MAELGAGFDPSDEGGLADDAGRQDDAIAEHGHERSASDVQRVHEMDMMGRAKVILVNNAYWPSIGGVENSIRHLACEAVSSSDDVCIVASDIGVTAATQVLAPDPTGAALYRYPQEPFRFGFLKPLNFGLSAWYLFAIFRRLRRQWPDATVVARHHFGVIAARLAGYGNVRYLVPTVIGGQVRAEGRLGWKSWVKQQLFVAIHAPIQRWALRWSEVFVFSELMRRQCAQLAGGDISCTITKPGVDARRFHPVPAEEVDRLRQELHLPLARPIILFVGRFVRGKGGTDILLAAANIPECHVVFVGAGPEQLAYEEIAREPSMRGRVTIRPQCRDVEKYYQCADVFVMASRYEMLGQTILEALCAGLVVAAYRRGVQVNTATEELGMDEYIRYADEFSVQSLGQALRLAIADSRTRSREPLSRLVASRFSWRRLYDQLVGASV